MTDTQHIFLSYRSIESDFALKLAAEALERIGTPKALEAVERWRAEQGKQSE